MRIFAAKGNNDYEVLWEDYLYDVDIEDYNAATAGNTDTDIADEIVVTSFPRTYIIDYENGKYGLQWFTYGTLTTHHFIGDLNKDGINEIGIGRGDTTIVFQNSVEYTGPEAVSELAGIVLDAQTTRITWNETSDASLYHVLRGVLEGDLIKNIVQFDVVGTSFVDVSLDSAKQYFYTVLSFNNALTPQEAPYEAGITPFVLLRPHPNNTVVAVIPISANQIEVTFSRAMVGREADKSLILLNTTQTPTAVIAQNRKVILSFKAAFATGTNALSLDTLLLDKEQGILSLQDTITSFLYYPTKEQYLYLTNWQIDDEKTALLQFRLPVSDAALDMSHYRVSPVGDIKAISWVSHKHDAVYITLEKARLGSLGYPVSITVLPAVCTATGVCMQENEGNTATFSAHESELNAVYVYPNPVRAHDKFEGRDGLRFANLTQQCSVQVVSSSGAHIATFEETDGDGGYEWNLIDYRTGKRIAPGLYLFYITNNDGQITVGQFSVLE